MIRRHGALLAATCLWAGGAFAQDGCAPFVESHAGGETATLRPHADAFRACTLAGTPMLDVATAYCRLADKNAPFDIGLLHGGAGAVPTLLFGPPF